MKTHNRLIIAILPLLLQPIIVLANSQHNTSSAKIMHVKCHIALADESEKIHYWHTKSMRLKSFEKKLIGRSVANNQGDKKSITEVFDCVHRGKTFISAKAQKVESNQEH